MTTATGAAGELPQRRLLTCREAAAYLAISARLLWALRNTGEIPAVPVTARAVRYDPADLDRWIESKKHASPREA